MMYNMLRLLNTLREQYVLLAIYLEFIFLFQNQGDMHA